MPSFPALPAAASDAAAAPGGLLAVFNALPGAYLLLTPALLIEAASDAYLAATRTERAPLLGRYLFDAFPDNPAAPEAHATRNLRASLAQVLATGQAHEMARQHYDVPDPARPGQFLERHWLPRNTPVLDAQGRVERIVHAVVDVTAQVRADAELQASQAREQAARADAEAQRAELQRIFEQAPVAIAAFRGPDYVIELANPLVCALWGRTPAQALHTPLFELLPEIVGQGFEQLLAGVMATGVPHVAQEMPSTIDRHGRRDTVYWNFVYLPLREADGRITGVLVAATEVSEQVLARQRVQELNEELAAINEELRASNEEFLLANTALAGAEQQLRQLNEGLEARVAERTGQLQAALRDAEQQREALRNQQGQLQQVMGQVPAFIATLEGPAHRHAYFNAGYYAWSGNRARVGLPVAEVYPEAVPQGFIGLLDEVYRTGQPFRGTEMRAELYDPATGRPVPRHVDFVYQPLTDAQGRTTGILVFIVDVTEKVRARAQNQALQAELLAAAQRQAQEREALYQVFEQTPALVQLLRGPGHRIDYVNSAYQRLFPGRPLVGPDLADALPELRDQGFVALMDRVYQTGETYFATDAPFVVPAAAGEPARTAYFSFTYQPYQENGQTAGISVFAIEVTEQVLARQERDAQRHELQRLFEQAPVAIAVFKGPRYVIEMANPAVCAMWGRTQQQALGTPLFALLPEAAGQGFEELLDGVLATGVPHVAHELPALIDRHGRRDTVYWSFVYQPLREADGRITGITVVATDVSEQVLARQRVQDLNQALQASNDELAATNRQLTRTNVDLDNFIYTASHDLKAPITNIEGLLLALRAHLPPAARDAPPVPHLLGLMQGAVERFQLTIAQLTDIAQLQQAHDAPAEALDLAAAVEAVRLDLAPALAAAGARLAVDVAPGLRVSFPPQNLRSVVYNLLSNAVKYRAPERPPQVQLRARRAGDAFVLEVQDNGLGLDAAQQAQLFGMFRRLHDHVEGTGVGLYMVKRMVENAGGTIAVQSQPGVGSTFTVSLPA